MSPLALRLAATGTFFFPMVGHSSEMPVVGMNYTLARKLLLRDGYSPVLVIHKSIFACIGGRDVCAKYPETISCAGSGQRPCDFEWRSRTGVLFVVSTTGELIDEMNVVGAGAAIPTDLEQE